MGTSPQESMAYEQLNRLKGFEGWIGTPTFNFQDVLSKVLGGLDVSGTLMTSAMSSNIGEQLASAGVAGGQPRSESYITAMAPYYSDIAKTKAMTTSDLAKFFAENQMQARQLLLTLMGLQGQSIRQMKDTTTLGDVLGILQSAANIFGGSDRQRGLYDLLRIIGVF